MSVVATTATISPKRIKEGFTSMILAGSCPETPAGTAQFSIQKPGFFVQGQGR
jgi:hypothetical protein